MEALSKTNMVSTLGYGEDEFCQQAKAKIRDYINCRDADIYFLVGGTQTNQVVIDQGKSIEIERSGATLFWGSPETVYGANDGSDYKVLEDTNIYINGKEINLRAGDNIHTIAARINSATVSVTAEVDPNNALVIRGNKTKQ